MAGVNLFFTFPGPGTGDGGGGGAVLDNGRGVEIPRCPAGLCHLPALRPWGVTSVSLSVVD